MGRSPCTSQEGAGRSRANACQGKTSVLGAGTYLHVGCCDTAPETVGLQRPKTAGRRDRVRTAHIQPQVTQLLQAGEAQQGPEAGVVHFQCL